MVKFAWAIELIWHGTNGKAPVPAASRHTISCHTKLLLLLSACEWKGEGAAAAEGKSWVGDKSGRTARFPDRGCVLVVSCWM